MASSSDGKEVKSVLDSKSMNDYKKQPQANMKANNSTIGIEFQHLLNSILEQKPPISKEKMGNIVKEAQKSVKHYKHIVYFVEVFIKKCPSNYKLCGLYIIDALIRSSKLDKSSQQQQQQQQQQLNKTNVLYLKRFAKNMCKTFSNVYTKCPQNDREKIARVLDLWQKYNVIDAELMDKLHRIVSSVKIETAVNSSNEKKKIVKRLSDISANGDNGAGASASKRKRLENNDDIDDKLNRLHHLNKKLASNESSSDEKRVEYLKSEIEKLKRELMSKGVLDANGNRLHTSASSSKRLFDTTHPNHQPNRTTTKHEISKLLELHNDLDSDSSDTDENKSDSSSLKNAPISFDASNEPITSDRMKASINNCVAWMKSNMGQSISSDSLSNDEFKLPKLNASERAKRALPNLREQHVCICSKTLWLGHLTKSITEEHVIEKLNELLAHNSNNSSRIISEVNLIPPRGCAYVEFADRAVAAQCLTKMKQGYRMDGNVIKVAWAINKGINDDKKMKKYWNVEVGCTYIPWIELMTSNSNNNNNTLEPINLVKLTEGGLIDEDSIPSHFYPIYKQKLASTVNKSSEAAKADDNDMDLESDEEHSKPVENGNSNANFANSAIPLPNPYQSIMLPSQIISSLQFLNQNPNGMNGKSGATNNNAHHLIQNTPPPPPPPGQLAQLPFPAAFSQTGLPGILQAHGAPPPPPRPPSNSLNQAPTSTTPTPALPPQFFNHHHLFQTIPPPPLQTAPQANGSMPHGVQIANESKQNENLAYLQGKPNNLMQILNPSQLVSIQPSAEFLDIHQMNIQKQQQQQQQQHQQPPPPQFHPHLAQFNQMPGAPTSSQPLQLNLRPIFLTKPHGNQLPILNTGFLSHLNLFPQGSQLTAPFNGNFVPSAEHMQAIQGLNQLEQLNNQFQKDEELNRLSSESGNQMSSQENKQALRSLMDMNFDRVASNGANVSNNGLNEEVRESSDNSLNKSGELEDSFNRSSSNKSYHSRRSTGDNNNNSSNRSSSNGGSFSKGYYPNNSNNANNNNNASGGSNYRNYSQNNSSNKTWNRNPSSNSNNGRYDSANSSKNHRNKNYDSNSNTSANSKP